MSLHISHITHPTAEQWDRIWAASDNATFYHSRWWHEIWQAYHNGKIRPAPLLLQFSDGTEALFTASTHRVGGGLIKRCLSSPASTYGGWISEKPLSVPHYNILRDNLREQFPILIMRFNPLAYHDSLADVPGFEDEETQMLALDKDFDSLYRAWTKGHKSAVTKARREGVVTRPAADQADWDLFYDMYQDTFQRWGKKATSRYYQNFFQSMCNLRSPHCRLWMAECNGDPVASAIIFYAKTHVMYAYPVTYERYHNLRPMNLLLYDIIQEACAAGYRWFDFGPSSGKKGVYSFKKSFGAQEFRAPMIRRQPGYLRLLEKAYKAVLIQKSRLQKA